MARNTSILILFLLGSFSAIGQIEWVGNHEFSEAPYENIYDLVRTAQNQYVLLHGNGITALDSAGNVVFSDYLGSYHISEAVATSDSSVLLFAAFFQCDLIVGEIIKYDKDWNMQWASPFAYDVNQVAYLSDSVIICENGNSIQRFHIESNGGPIWEAYLGNGFFVNDICFSPEENILVSTAGGLAVVGIDGLVDTIYQSLKFDKLELSNQGFYYAQIGDTLIQFSENFQPLDTFSTGPFHISDFSTGSDVVWLLTSEPRIIKLSSQLEEEASFPLNFQNETVGQIIPYVDGALVAGREKYGENIHSNYSTFVKSYGADASTLNTQRDVGMTSITMDTPIVKYLGNNVPYVTFHNIKTAVKNYGATHLDRLNINVAFPWFDGECPRDQRFSIPFNNVNILPGETTELIVDSLNVYFLAGTSGPLEICMWTSLPDHHFDIDPTNDVACTDVFVKTAEPKPLLFNTSFFPDSDELQLQFAQEFAGDALDLKLFNASGQLVASETALSGDRINLAHLPDGLYIVQAFYTTGKGGDKVGLGKVLKY